MKNETEYFTGCTETGSTKERDKGVPLESSVKTLTIVGDEGGGGCGFGLSDTLLPMERLDQLGGS